MASTDFPQTLGARIREARLALDLTVEQMAPKVGVTMRTLSRYERGETKQLSFDRLADISKVTGRPVSWFITGEEPA